MVEDSGVVAERYEYTPYGELSFFAADYTPRTTSSYDTRYTYTNRESTPEAHWYTFRNRWYDPVLGRFCSRDPIGYVDSLELYSYVKSSPLVYLDPTGTSVYDVLSKCQQYVDSVMASLPPSCGSRGWTISLSCVDSNRQTLLPGEAGVTGCYEDKVIKITIFYDRLNTPAEVDAAVIHELSHASDFCKCAAIPGDAVLVD